MRLNCNKTQIEQGRVGTLGNNKLYDKTHIEIYALLFIKQYWVLYSEGFVKGESPDWKNEKSNTGIEVCEAITTHYGYTLNLAAEYLGHKKNDISKEIEKFQGTLYFDEYNKLYSVSPLKGTVDGRQPMCHALKELRNKLILLNTDNFTKYKSNALCLLFNVPQNKMDVEFFINEAKKIIKDYRIGYDVVFLLCHDFYYIDIPSWNYYCHLTSTDDLFKINELSNKMRLERSWENGEPFD